MLLAVACERQSAPETGAATRPAEGLAAALDEHLPTFSFAPGLRAAHPEVAAFLDEFLTTCLLGDYAGYRRLVSRAFEPLSRERFEAIYRATRTVRIDSIEPVEVPRIPPPVYCVVSHVELDPQQQARLRESQRDVAILVFREGADWRMAPAPAALQPRKQPTTQPASAPTTSAPSYPWDEQGDY